MCDNFNAAYGDRGLTIEYVQYKNSTDGNIAVENFLFAGDGIDVLISYGNLSKLTPRTENGLLLDLSKYLTDFDIKAELGEHATDGIIWEGGSYYGLPTTFSNGGTTFLINKDMFDAAGIPIPYDGWTYSEFLDACEKLTTGEGDDKVYGFCFNSGDLASILNYVKALLGRNFYYTDTTKNESSYLDKAWSETLNVYRTAADNGWACDWGTCKAEKHSVSNFVNGECAMLNTNSQLRQCMDLENYPHDFVTAVVPCPIPDGEEYVQYKAMNHMQSIGEYVAAAAKTEHPEQAAEFVRWFVQGGMNPTIMATRYPLWLGNNIDDIAESLEQLANGTVDITSIRKLFEADRSQLPLGDSSTALDSKMKEQFKNVVDGFFLSGSERKFETAEDAMQEAYKNAQAILDAATPEDKT